jgi:MFS family permease
MASVRAGPSVSVVLHPPPVGGSALRKGGMALNTTVSGRKAGATQALTIILAMTLPVTPLLSLVSNLPQLFRHFAGTPNSDVLIPLILTMPSVCIFLLSPIAGVLIDRFGRRRVLLASALIFTVCGLAPFWLEDLKSVLIAQFGVGLGEACLMPVCNALIGDYYDSDGRQHWLGVQAILGSILATVVALSGGYLGTLSWHHPFLTNALGGIVFLWAYLSIFEPSGAGGPASTARGGFPWKAVGPVFAVTVPVAILYFIQAVQLGLMFEKHDSGSSLNIAVMTTIASIGVWIGGAWFRRQKGVAPPRLIATILLVYGIGLAGIGLTHSSWAALPFAVIAQMGNGLAVPVLVAWVLSKLDFQFRGRGMGLWSTTFFFGQFAGPALFALFVRAVAGDFLRSVAWTGGLCLVGAAITFLACRDRSGVSA